MAISGTVQALIAAFFFGILVNTASAGLFLYIKGHGSTIFRDGLRLALILFLASSALWAQVEFLATLIDSTASSTCQAAVSISSLFDQLARVSIEQFLIWAIAKDGRKSAAGLATQVLLLARFVVGMVFVGVTKPQFNSTCVPLSSIEPVAITVIALDAVILTAIAALALSARSGKTVLLILAALAIWMGTSVTLLLGMSTIDMFFRTTLPAIGLLILTSLVTILSSILPTTQPRRPLTPDSPTPQTMNRNLDISTSSSDEYPPSRYAEVKGTGSMVVTGFPDSELAPKNGNASTLPTLARPVTGVTGIGGVPVRGQLFPPPRSNTVDQVTLQSEVRTRIDLPQRSKSNPPRKMTKGKLVISAPIPIDKPETQDAFNKIPTIDLATAAKNEQERRDGYARRKSALIANRPAPKPPVMQKEEPSMRSTGIKRQEIEQESFTEIGRTNSNKTAKSGGLSVEGNASSSSAQLSPGNEELRRRSPRQVMPTAIPAKTPNKASTFQPITPGQPFRIPIPRAQPPPEPAPVKVPEPVKTPLQRRPTNGLPSNPRAQTVKRTSEDSETEQGQTVMFINKITYDDPTYVNDIIQGATATKTPRSPLKSSNSVVHRPRPIPRKGDKDRLVFPAEVSAGHRRSKSAGSILNRRSILQSQAGSPTQLPPLPPPPQSLGEVQRPHPNDTKSMTFDEKMSLFYTGPPSASSVASTPMMKRRSSVPEMPPLPPTLPLLNGSPLTQNAPKIDGERRFTQTTATDRTSIRTQSILGVGDYESRDISETNTIVVDGLSTFRSPGVVPTNDAALDMSDNRRQSSPVIPVLRYSSLTASTVGRTHDDGTTDWGSVHSPVAAIDMSATRLNVRSTYIKKDSKVPSILSGFGDEVMTVMLDTSSEHSTANRQSFFLDDESVPDVPQIEQRLSKWHHRVGEECPTFSTRKERVKSRKMPPPTPLLLRTASQKGAVVIHTAEPSPMESPNAAYNKIQAQLQRFDEPNRDSIGSEGRRMALLEDLELEMGQQESRWQTMQNNLDRDSISTLQTDSRPISIYSPAKSSTRPQSISSALAERRASRRARLSRANVSKEDLVTATRASLAYNSGSQRESIFQMRLAAAELELAENAPELLMSRSSLNFFTISKADLGSPTPPESDTSDYEMEFQAQLLSARTYEPPATKQISHLWQPNPPKIRSAAGLMWEAPIQGPESEDPVELPGLSVRPAIRKSAEPLKIYSTRLWQKPLSSAKSERSVGLWGQKTPQPSSEPAKPVKARPLTQRPPRRSKRVTLLPDILESPEPLPDKRGTLGIFQFPWGERSANATVQPRPSQVFMAMPGTMTSGGPRISASLEARARQLEADEYESSFFDDYDEEDEGDNFDDEYEDSGDEFDENTLWEIAGLLQTSVPSRESLFPSEFSPSVIDDYMAERTSEDQLEEYDEDFNMVSEEDAVRETIALFPKPHDEVTKTFLWEFDTKSGASRESFGLTQPADDVWQSYIPTDAEAVRLRSQFSDPAITLESNQLWMPASLKTYGKPLLWTPHSRSSGTGHHLGLPQPDLAIWLEYMPGPEVLTRSNSRVEEPAKIESTSLWTPVATTPTSRTSLLWASPLLELKVPETTSARQGNDVEHQRRSFMWEKPILLPQAHLDGLFNAKTARADFRRTSATPPAAAMIKKPRTNKEPLQTLTTRGLWKNVPKLVARSTGKRQTLWSSTSVRVANTTTLFQLDVTRKTYRTTTVEPAALNMVTRPRKSNAPLPRLETSSFWKATDDKKAKVNWIKLCSSKVTASKPATSSQGLFKMDSTRKQWRTTSASPAALDMTTKSRSVDAPLPQLESTRLWSPTRTASVEADWITISSVRPRSPSVASIASTSSALPSPVTDASSIRTTSTKASTIAPSVSSMFGFRGFFGRKKAEPEIPSTPEDAALPQIPEIPDEAFIVKNLDEVPRKKVVRTPKRSVRRPSIVSEKDWDAALEEAIKASHIAPKIVRRPWSPKEWSMALNEAISASYPNNRFSRGQVLPAQWDEELREAIARSQRPAHDVSTRHPVFFGSMTTTATDVHPAMYGSVKGTPTLAQTSSKQPLLWSESVPSSSNLAANMWAPPAGQPTSHTASSLPEVPCASARKQTKTPPSTIPVPSFTGQDMWKRQGPPSKQRDWLDDTMKKRFTRVELRY
ncbi:hypothetical protein PFICI_14363 [Pestalotiopsis fici W106-1]|uniref:Uncharacterized protein n=1 Tax=Pestalotiopsis fici (strain W106-1 / CGMCC3.15140) TaxID=1229662 RepID=W3WMV4_PESFW|nr:uncharacterized protein PFICI_14363 [Pestalotiopsis fici W106-1]ETS74497.1 hypothetical protein PFICI_14363 [Pestalotiopsis fici W106-1]